MPVTNDRFPSAPQAALLLLALFLIEYVTGTALFDLHVELDLSATEIIALTTLLANGIVFSVLMHCKKMHYRNLFHPSSASVRVTLALLLVSVVLVVSALVLAANGLNDVLLKILPLSRWEEQAFERMLSPNMASLVAVCVLAPVLEEMLFRGIILRAFLLQYPRWTAILASAVFFGFAHMNVYQFVVAFLLGTFSGWLYERTRSLVPCIVLHASYNAAVFALQTTPSADTAQFLQANAASYWAIALAAAAVGSLMLRQLLFTRAT